MISRTSAYALEAAIIIAAREGERITAADLAAELDLPGNYLSKILNTMSRARLLESERGPRGGFTLARDPADVAVADIIGLFEEIGSSRRCFLGRGKCSDTDSCAMHDRWKKVSSPMFDFFRDTTLDSIVADHRRKVRTVK